MAEESEGNFDPKKKIANLNPNAKALENGWIVCRSQKRPEYYYYFNTITGESVWRDRQEPLLDAPLIDKTKLPFECHEPTEPPTEAKSRHYQNAMPSGPAPKIYNKQIINNQFPAKSFPIEPFGNSACAPCGLLNTNNGMGMSTPVWLAASPQVLLGPSVAALNFHVLNKIHNDILNGSSVVDGGDGRQSFKNCNNFRQRPNQNCENKHFNRPPKDLRNILSNRRRSFHNTCNDNSESKQDQTADINANDLKPDDTDEWLEAHTDSEGKMLTVDIDCIWDLADSNVSRDCWYIVPTARALLNNMRFITSLVITDERLRLLAPQDAVRALRSAAFSDDGRLADCASRARTFAIRQMSKIPHKVKSAANVKSCRELIGPDIHIVRLIDERDNISKNDTSDVQITAAELKCCFKSTTNTIQPVSKIQKIVEGIKIVVPNNEVKTDSLSRLDPAASQSTQVATKSESERTVFKAPNVINTESGLKETEIQTDLSVPEPPSKQTANACVQTDFDFIFIPSTINPQETTINQGADSEASSDKITTKTPSRKIKLKRHQSTTAASNSDEQRSFRWRKRKDPLLLPSVAPPQTENQHKSVSRASSPPSIPNSNLLAHENDNAMDFGHSDASVNADIVVESSTSGVISNSVDSETMFKIKKQAILSQSRTEGKEKIVMYEITSDSMKDRLSMRWDEWRSRYVQTMEEVLSQVLLLEPALTDDMLPAPWTLQEATECIKLKFKDHSIIVDASDILNRFLLRIHDDPGNTETRMSPADFMQMFSYGVNLVSKLQLVMEKCEDLHIASQNLSKLLSDIREPGLDESYEIENFNIDDPINYSPNISESVTDLSATVPEKTAPANFISPQKERKRTSCNNSPARYSLRSSRSAEQKAENTVGVSCSEDKAYNLFTSLGLQKTAPKVPVTPPFTETQDEDSAAQSEPKIIRNFTINPELEKKLLSNCANIGADRYEDNYAYGAEDYGEDEYTGNPFSDQYLTDDYIDFEDNNANIEQYGNENCVNNNDILKTTSMDVDQTFENSESGDLNANEILKQCVKNTTHKYRRWLADLHKFCKVTNAAMKTTDSRLVHSREDVAEKTREVSEHAKNVCNRLKCILHRDPYVTSKKFHDVMKEYGVQDFDMNDVQLAEYRVTIERYLKLAQQLSTCVTRLADSAKV